MQFDLWFKSSKAFVMLSVLDDLTVTYMTGEQSILAHFRMFYLVMKWVKQLEIILWAFIVSEGSPSSSSSTHERGRFPLSSSARSYRPDRRRSESGVLQQISDESSLPAQFPAAHHLPSQPLLARRALDMPRQAGRHIPETSCSPPPLRHPDEVFGGERPEVDSVKESKWGASECRGCSILICVFGCFLSGSFPCITPWIPRRRAPPHSRPAGYVLEA